MVTNMLTPDAQKVRWVLVRWEFYGYAFIGLFGAALLLFASLFSAPEEKVLFLRWMALFSVLFLSFIGLTLGAWKYWRLTRQFKKTTTPQT